MLYFLNTLTLKMFYRIGRIFSNYKIIHLQKFSTVNIYNARKNILLSNFVVKKHPIRQKSIFQLISRETTEGLKKKDNVPDLFQLIYRNTMGKYLLVAQILSTLITGFVCIGLLLKNDTNEFNLTKEVWKSEIGYVSNEMYIYLIALIGFCATLQVLVSKMPLRMYNYPKQKEYIMIFYGAFPGSTKRVTFTADEITKLSGSGLLPWRDSSYEVKDKGTAIFIEKYFRTPADLNIMLGYQKHPDVDE